ncbi:hypothetical protein EVAR_18660_1 [Eumeta japonica]|uniref:Uncharacterized protein n=1 Tax=Eumeta variegata TaxID=151549 RepID=A0A4C1U6S5_EUMVA|nr:hypothetical protein EVAR_18660_1 [Eumeta japonica]
MQLKNDTCPRRTRITRIGRDRIAEQYDPIDHTDRYTRLAVYGRPLFLLRHDNHRKYHRGRGLGSADFHLERNISLPASKEVGVVPPK